MPTRRSPDPNHPPTPRRTVLSSLRLVGLIVMVTVVSLIAGGCSSAESNVPAFDSLPFTTSSGQTATLADYRGQPLVVNFFASWCAPCRAEMADFEAVHQTSDVTFVGVSHDFDEQTWRGLVAETGITFETVFQPDQGIFEAIGGVGMPTTAFISPDGELLSLHTGPMDQAQLRASIDQYLTPQ